MYLQFLVLPLGNFEPKVGFGVSLNNESVDVIGGELDTSPLEIIVNLFAESVVHAFLMLWYSHVLLSDLFFEIEVVSNSSLVDVGFERRLD